jgi:hypothetical protein
MPAFAAPAAKVEVSRVPPDNPASFHSITVGVNTHYASGGSVNHDALARLAEAGVSFIRNDLTWASVEKEAGVYDFVGPGFDELVDTCETLGLRILFILDYGNPLYGETQAVVDEEGRRAFAAFAAAAASRYGGRGHSWEIWNEPNLEQFWSSADGGPDPELYAELIHTTAPALRAADPDGKIVVGALLFGFLSEIIETLGLGISGPHFLETLAATGVLSLVDEVTIHLYRTDAPEGAATDIQVARDLLDGAGYPLPVSSGEWGYSTYDPNAPPTGINFLPAVTLNRQASYLARMLLFNYSLGLRRSVIFKDLDNQDPSPGNIEHHWGLMFEDLTPKPSLAAISTLTGLLGDAGPPYSLPLGPKEHGLVFHRRDGSRVVALWSEEAATWLLRTGDATEGARIVGRDGSDLTPPDLAGGALFSLGPDEGPVYLIGQIELEPRIQDTDQQKCINALNKNLAKVAKAQGKDIQDCIKDYAKGKDLTPAATIEECLTADRKGKVAKATGKTESDETKKCSGTPPDFGATDSTIVNATAIQKKLDLIHEVFGSDLDTVVLPEAELTKDESKCQQAITKAVQKCQDAKFKEFNKCKKSGLKDESMQGFVGLQENCLGTGAAGIPDAGGKIVKACETKILSTINKKCGTPVDTSTAFSGCPPGDAAALAACLDQKVECQVCRALNQADVLSRDCDEFDDGVVNTSCP